MARALSNLDRHVWLTSFDAWGPSMLELIEPYDAVDLTEVDLSFILGATPTHGHAATTSGTVGLSPATAAELDDILSDYPEGAHARLGLCSFKFGPRPEPVRSAGDIVRLMSLPNPRVAAVVEGMLQRSNPTRLYLRHWVEIPPWTEFRIFFRDGEVVGASQYRHDQVYPQIEEREGGIREAIIRFCYRIRRRLPLPSCIADVRILPQTDPLEAALIELNPFVRRTDPCLFDWSNPAGFDGTFRYHFTTT